MSQLAKWSLATLAVHGSNPGISNFLVHLFMQTVEKTTIKKQ